MVANNIGMKPPRNPHRQKENIEMSKDDEINRLKKEILQLQLQNRKFREALEFASDFIPPSMTQIDENGEIINCECPVCSALRDESADIALKQHENKIIRAAVEYAFNATGVNEGLSISDEEIEVWRKKLLDETN